MELNEASTPIGLLLGIDTSSSSCRIAIRMPNGEFRKVVSAEVNDHSVSLTPMIHELLLQNDLSASQLSGLVINSGPGSYTGLRIGYATAKGLCFALGIPLYAVPGLQVLALTTIRKSSNYKQFDSSSQLPFLLATYAARGTAIYAQLFNSAGIPFSEPFLYSNVSELLATLDVNASYTVAGSAADRILETHANSRCITHSGILHAEAHDLLVFDNKHLRTAFTCDLASCEPFYVIEYEAKKSISPFLIPSSLAATDHSGG